MLHQVLYLSIIYGSNRRLTLRPISVVVFSALSPSPAGLPMAFRPGHWCSFSSQTIPVGNVRVGASGLAPGLLRACTGLAPGLLRACSRLAPGLLRACTGLAPGLLDRPRPEAWPYSPLRPQPRQANQIAMQRALACLSAPTRNLPAARRSRRRWRGRQLSALAVTTVAFKCQHPEQGSAAPCSGSIGHRRPCRPAPGSVPSPSRSP